MPTHPHTKPNEELLQLQIPVVLPGVDDPDDGCVSRLAERISEQSGVLEAHATHEGGSPTLCLHYDPNMVPLSRLERLAHEAGAEISERFRHETVPVGGMHCASCAASVEHVLKRQEGVLSASVSFASERLKVEYDSQLTSLDQISDTLRALGYSTTRAPAPHEQSPGAGERGHTHSHQHGGHGSGLPGIDLQLSLVCGALTAVAFVGERWLGLGSTAAHGIYVAAYLAGGWKLARHTFPAVARGRFDVDLLMLLAAAGAAILGDWAEGALLLFLFSLGHALESSALNRARTAIRSLDSIVPRTARVRRPQQAEAHGHEHHAGCCAHDHGSHDHEHGSCGHDHSDHSHAEHEHHAGCSHDHEAHDCSHDHEGCCSHDHDHHDCSHDHEAHEGGAAEEVIEIPVEELRVGDVAIVRPGERVAVDGQVLAGHSSLDQSAVTGESVPIEAAPGTQVFAGAINGDGALEVRVQKLARDTTMARVIALVEEAQDQKSPTQTFAERFERVFVPTILVGVLLAAVVPPTLGWLSWPDSLRRALSALVAASPCALALATPAAILAGIAQAARHGVLIKGGVHLENLGALDAIALDKTGTLTLGRPEVAAVAMAEDAPVSEHEMLRLAASAESRSSHPLAQAVVRAAQSRGLELLPEGELQNLPGRGVRAQVGGRELLIGNARLFEEESAALPAPISARIEEWGAQGWPSMIVAQRRSPQDALQVLGALALADPLRPEAKGSLEALRAMGVRDIVMLTGDNALVAEKIAREAGVTSTRADLLPSDKAAVLRQMAAGEGGVERQVAMVGDGVNDAPALAVADVGIAMGAGGTDVALETADVALMSSDLSKLAFAVGLSRAARGIIRQNLWIALGMIALLLPTTLLGATPISLAVVMHEGSTLVVVFNALRLLGYKPAAS